MRSNSWDNVVKYFNSKFGETLTIIDVEVDLNYLNAKVLSSYRTLLIKCGYVKKVSRGVYKVVKKVPENLRYMDVNREAWPSTKKNL